MPRSRRVGVVKFLILLAWLAPSSLWAASGDPTCAKDYATLRKGPGSSYSVSWRVARFMPFLRFEAKSSWVKVQDLDGEMHWARSKDLTSSLSCVVVRAQVANLRKEPSAAAALAELRSVDRFTPFKRIESEGDWVKVEDETGRQAWIHHTNIWRPVKVLGLTF